MRQRLPKHFLSACALFGVSGALGLGYQLVWIRKASLLVGASQIALATVVTSFFLGLGLGSLFVGRHLRSRRWSPLLVYGAFEAAIGAFALVFPRLFEGTESVYAALYPWLADSATALFFGRFALLFLLFLPATFLMGGTLPLLLDGLVERDGSIGSLTSVLYGLNIVGAVIGVLGTGYFAIPALGMDTTSRVFGVGNFAVAGVAWAAFRGQPPLHAVAGDGAARAALPLIFVAMSFASGFAAIGYQVAWVRYFSLFNTASVYLTSVLLAVYLLALATGSLAFAPFARRGVHPLRVVALLQPWVVVLVLTASDWWTLAGYGFAADGPPGSFEVAPSWSFVSEQADSIFFAPLFQVALVLFLPVALLGTGLPALIAAATASSRALRANAGSLVFWNTVGSGAGGFATGYLLLPGVGLSRTLLALSLVTLALAVAAEWTLGRARGSWLRRALIAAACVYALLLANDDLTARTIREHGAGRVAAGAELVEVLEGPLTTAFVFEDDQMTRIGSGNVVLAVVAHRYATTQAIQGHLPILFRPGPGTPRRALGIALGSGQSFGALLLHPIESLEVVDISSEMVDLSLRRFEALHHLGSDERVRIHLDDGRHFIDRAADASYDVVSMEPPPPTAEGVYSLYSSEFYAGVERILREDGVLMQWLPLYRLTPNDVRGLIRTQAAVFPWTFVAKVGIGDFVLLSFKRGAPPKLDTRWIAERAETFATDRFMAKKRWPGCPQRVASLEGALAMLVTGPDDIAAMQSGPVYHDDDQRLSYTSGDRELLRRYPGRLLRRLSFAALPITPFERLQRYFVQRIDVSALEEARACSLSAYGVPAPRALARAKERYAGAKTPSARVDAALALARLHDAALAKGEALAWVDRAIAADPSERRPTQLEAARSVARNGIGLFSGELRRWLAERPVTHRNAPLVEAMEAELRAHEEREAQRRSRYLIP